jgi:hypothetical protein
MDYGYRILSVNTNSYSVTVCYFIKGNEDITHELNLDIPSTQDGNVLSPEDLNLIISSRCPRYDLQRKYAIAYHQDAMAFINQLVDQQADVDQSVFNNTTRASSIPVTKI